MSGLFDTAGRAGWIAVPPVMIDAGRIACVEVNDDWPPGGVIDWGAV